MRDIGDSQRLTATGLVTGATLPGVLEGVGVYGTAAGVATIKDGGASGTVLLQIPAVADDWRVWSVPMSHNGELHVTVPASCEVVVVYS